jgi:GxxExxY protein
VSRRDAEGAEGKNAQEPEEGLNRLTEAVIGAAIEVHRVLGPGFLESLYEQALCLELARRAIFFARQVGVSVLYKGTPIGEARLDLVVEGRLLVELKATEGYAPTHLAQVLSYLKATQLTLGLLINFNVPSLRQGLRRVVRTPIQQNSASSASLRLPLKLSTQ